MASCRPLPASRPRAGLPVASARGPHCRAPPAGVSFLASAPRQSRQMEARGGATGEGAAWRPVCVLTFETLGGSARWGQRGAIASRGRKRRSPPNLPAPASRPCHPTAGQEPPSLGRGRTDPGNVVPCLFSNLPRKGSGKGLLLSQLSPLGTSTFLTCLVLKEAPFLGKDSSPPSASRASGLAVFLQLTNVCWPRAGCQALHPGRS